MVKVLKNQDAGATSHRFGSQQEHARTIWNWGIILDMRSNSYIQLRFCFSKNLDICIHPTKIYLSNLDITGYGFWICLKVGCPKICEAVNLKIFPSLATWWWHIWECSNHIISYFGSFNPHHWRYSPHEKPSFYRFLKADPKIISSWVLKPHDFPLNSIFFRKKNHPKPIQKRHCQAWRSWGLEVAWTTTWNVWRIQA